MAVSFKGAHFPRDIILTCVRWYVAYPLSYRHVEELRQERGVSVDHTTVNRWVVKYSPLQSAAGSGVPPPQAVRMAQLAARRYLHSGQRRVEVPVSRGGKVRPND
jgi:hypothetical protein